MMVRTRVLALIVGSVGFLAASAAARADHQPVIAWPGNPQVPVIIDGVPATGALVTGDWGLYAPGRVTPQIYMPAFAPYDPELLPPARHYFPKTGRRPAYGRKEVEGPRYLPPPAPTFYREWSTSSDREPATQYPPYEPPPVIMAPDRRPSRSYDRSPGER
jgi:hypothetical protein